MFCLRSLTFLVLVSASGAVAQTNSCQVPDQMKKDQKLPCVRAGGFMVDQPALSLTQLSNGPDFDAAEPENKPLRVLHGSGQRLVLLPPALCLHECQGR